MNLLSIPSLRRLRRTSLAALLALVGIAPMASAQIAVNFEAGLPPESELFGLAALQTDSGNTSVHLTEPEFGTNGYFRLNNIGDGKPVRAIRIQWRSLIGGGEGGGADGYSLNWATDLSPTPDFTLPAEEGLGSGLTVTVDTFDNGFGEAPGIEIRWKSNLVAAASISQDDLGGGLPYLRKNQFVEAEVTVDAKGQATFTYDGVSIGAQLAGWKGIAGGDLLFGARTGGANDRHWIDDLRVTTGLFTAGTYNGLIADDSNFSHDTSGSISIKVTPQGSFSGLMMLGGVRLPLSGRFDLATLSTRLQIARPGTTSLTVDLALSDKNTIKGTVGNGLWSVIFSSRRAAWHKTLNPATSYAGQYVLFVSRPRGESFPNGYGYGTVTVDTGGGVKFAGVTGDGSKVTQKSTLSADGLWPLFALTHGGQGSILTWLRVSPLGTRENEGAWFKKPGVPGPLHPNGFSLMPAFSISPYTPPAPGDRILPFSTGIASFSSSEVSFFSRFGLTPASQVIDLGVNGLELKFVPKTGLFSGTVTAPGTTARLKFGGVAVPREGVGLGTFIGTAQSGAVALREEP